jgi:hypothetical protein
MKKHIINEEGDYRIELEITDADLCEKLGRSPGLMAKIFTQNFILNTHLASAIPGATIIPYTPPEPPPEPEPEVELTKQDKLDKLWLECKVYASSRLDDAGFYRMDKKADEGGAMAQANVSWYEAIWQDYFERKTEIENDIVTDPDYDFSNHGEMPHNFYDAYAESAQ